MSRSRRPSAALGMEVSVIEALPRIMTIMDEDMSRLVADEMTRNRVKIITGKKVVGFRGSGRVEKVILDGGDSVDADCVVLVNRGSSQLRAGSRCRP